MNLEEFVSRLLMMGLEVHIDHVDLGAVEEGPTDARYMHLRYDGEGYAEFPIDRGTHFYNLGGIRSPGVAELLHDWYEVLAAPSLDRGLPIDYQGAYSAILKDMEWRENES